MSKLLRLYNSWDQYSCGDFETKDEVMLSNIKRSSSSQMSRHSSRSSSESFYSNATIDNAVLFKDVKMSYGKGKKSVNVLKGINMKVPEGAIYALLGPSGCGKTTLCNCITGRNKPTQGTVEVFKKIPGTPGSNVPGPIIGYMPQEISLFPDFSIEETLMYFSKLYRLDPARAADRVDFLVDFLELPDKRRMVANLSGGQQRRVSLAAALIHSPPLLILDEPTVGVDPVLRQVIWDYLVLLSTKERLSIIITTHYIEEARAANVCGLMRQGKLLVEESPDFLMEKYKCPTLEAVFLQLSRASDSKSTPEVYVHQYQQHQQQQQQLDSKPPVPNGGLPILQEVSAEGCDTTTTTIGAGDAMNQTVIAAGTGVAIMGPPQTTQEQHRAPTMKQLAKEKQALNQAKSDALKASAPGGKMPNGESIEGVVNGRLVPKFERFQIEAVPKSKFEAFSQETTRSFNRIGALTSKNFARLMRNLPVLLFQFMLPSVEVILFCLCIGQEPFNLPLSIYNEELHLLNESLVERTSTFSYQYLNEINNRSVIQVNYNSKLEAIEAVKEGKTWGAVVIGENFTDNLKTRFLQPEMVSDDLISGGNVHLHLDMSNYLISLQLQRILLQAFQTFAMNTMAAFNVSKGLAQLPVEQEKPIYGDREPTFTEFMAPGVLLSIAFLAAVALTAIALVQERKEGVLERSLVAGVTSTEFIMSHVITQLLVLHVQVFLLLMFTFLVFEIPSRGYFFWVILLTLLQSSCGMAFGLMISAMTKEETSATMLALGSFYPNLLLSGTVWPTQAMPDAMRYFAYCLPQTLPIESLRYILSRGWDITHAEVATGFAVTIAWTTFFLIVAVVVFKAKI
uniref:ABC transporter G family member 23 n=1 Tax=Aceria tosichella TaxID=561515 RepID=A0A6G1S9A6_9ACAR